MKLLIKSNKGFSFIILAILMVLVIVMVYLFFELFKYHLSLVVKTTYNYNKYQNIPMTLYDLNLITSNGCEKNLYSNQNCNIPIIFEISNLNFLQSPDTTSLEKVLNSYKNYITTAFYLSLGIKNTYPIASQCGSGGCDNYDLGLIYPIPLIPNPSSLLANFTFQIKG